MPAGPLPIRVRLVHGEVLDSYAHRLASANHTSVAQVERDLRSSRAFGTTRDRRHPERLRLWRALGDLSPAAFAQHGSVQGIPVAVRAACRRCSRGDIAYVCRPDIGSLCVNHRRWLGPTQANLPPQSALLSAERHFRRDIAPKGVLFDSPIMVNALAAALAGVAQSTLEQRATETGLSVPEVLVYPEQIAIARALTTPNTIGHLTDPEVPIRARREALADVLESALGTREQMAVVAAANRLYRAIDATTRMRLDGNRASFAMGPDIEFGLLRLVRATRPTTTSAPAQGLRRAV